MENPIKNDGVVTLFPLPHIFPAKTKSYYLFKISKQKKMLDIHRISAFLDF